MKGEGLQRGVEAGYFGKAGISQVLMVFAPNNSVNKDPVLGSASAAPWVAILVGDITERTAHHRYRRGLLTVKAY